MSCDFHIPAGLRVALSLLLVCHLANARPFDSTYIDKCCDSFEMLSLEERPEYKDLSAEQFEVILTYLLPVTGSLLYLRPDGTLRPFRRGDNFIEFFGFEGSKNLRIEWVDVDGGPWVSSNVSTRTLHIPRKFDLKTLHDEGQPLVMEFLMGHQLHPFSGSKVAASGRAQLGEPTFLHKQVQQDGVDAAIAASDAGHRSFLYVAPTGTGKTKVLTDLLDHRLGKSKNKLTVLVADANPLVKQLEGDVRDLAAAVKKRKGMSTEPFEIIRWGDEEGSSSIADLMAKVEASDKPVVLVTTIQSFKTRMAEGNPDANQARVRKHLDTFAYDEAHHTGAPQAQDLIRSLIYHNDSKAFLYGTTATPTHRAVRIQADIFENRAFWAYLDDPTDYVRRPGAQSRDVGDMEKQLRLAIQAGELTPFDGIFFIDRNRLTIKNKTFYEPTSEDGNGSAYRINAEHRLIVGQAIQPLLRNHKKGFLAVPSVEDAIALKEILNKITPGKRFEVVYGEMPGKQKVIDRFKEKDSDIDFLITVRMLDEGINHPDLSLYIDLNRTVGPRQRLQRMGRVLRLAEGKENVQMAMLRDPFDFNQLADDLRFVDAVGAGTYSGGGKGASGGKKGGHEDYDPDVLIKLDDKQLTDQAKRLQDEMRRMWQREGKEPAHDAMLVNEFWRKRTGKKDGTGDPDGVLDLPSSDSKTYPEEAKLRGLIVKHKRNPAFLATLDPGARARIIKYDLENQLRGVYHPGTLATIINKYVDELVALPRLGYRSEKKLAEVVRDYRDDPTFKKTLSEDAKEFLEHWKETD